MSHKPAATEYVPGDRVDGAASHWITSGRLKVATVDLLQLGKPEEFQHDLSISKALAEQRSES